MSSEKEADSVNMEAPAAEVKNPPGSSSIVLSHEGNQHNLTFAIKDPPETLRALIAAVAGVPIDTVGGLKDPSSQRNYTFSPSILPENSTLELLPLVTYSSGDLRKPAASASANSVAATNGDYTPAAVAQKKRGPQKIKRPASPPSYDNYGMEDMSPPAKKARPPKSTEKASAPRPKRQKFDINSLDPAMRECHNLLVNLRKHKYAVVFNKPVDHVALRLTDYLQIIKHPMDLGTVLYNLEGGDYATPEDFAADIRLTFKNALTYNPPDSEVHIMAGSMSRHFEKSFSTMKEKLNDAGAEDSKPATEETSQMDVDTKEKTEEPAKDMTAEEKRTLSQNINMLQPHQLGELVQIIHQRMPNLVNQQPDEIEIDLEMLDASTLRYLDKYVKKCLNKSKKKAESS
eukprot:TRINITY_DN11608_c0_g1_i1.p1 TRINITY_DN11608_c0_g1~~TRINITY_DN11608_c0_g1_i1.p1  ORF type:complete len:402 (+),score=134.52 TRINITY_DN11608_c0_g1_i1:327-1532(+)